MKTDTTIPLPFDDGSTGTQPAVTAVQPKKPASFAFSNGCVVRSAGAPCPYCGCQLCAHDVEVDDHGVRYICPCCHKDVLNIEASQQ
jgi:hypothetical protein